MSRFMKSFSDDEKIVAKSHRSYLSLIPILLIWGVIIGALAVLIFLDFSWLTPTISNIALAIVCGLAAISIIAELVRCLTTKAVLTSFRLVCSTGVFTKHIIEIPLERIDNVFLQQTIFARMFSYGKFQIFTSSSMYKFSKIAKAYKFKTCIMQSYQTYKREFMVYQANEIAKALQTEVLL